jgi:aminopeptidase N
VPNLRSLTSKEARARASILDVNRYDIDVDMTDLADGNALQAVSTIRFSCREPGASTFVDCAAEVATATLNGQPIPSEAIGDARIELTDLASDNVLVVESVQRSTDQGTSVHRSVDPADGKVYVWTSFEPDEARRAWACFDQPDLKAPHAFTVTAPPSWTVVSNSDDPLVEEIEGGRRWTYADTPPLSTYVPVVNAGPYYELRSERGGYDLGLYARQSLSSFLDRDAEELFDVTASGLAFFGEQFDMPFPQRTYDQVFAPDMGGAMENYGCVTWSDAFIFRSTPSPQEREERAIVLLHEMAHMWFGDIVTMRWWDDLWLNEAFAEWACYWSGAAATEFTDAWAGFLVTRKLAAYPVDRGPTSHPIRQSAGDVAEATAGFDAITYMKGAGVLKQLVAYVGEDAFVSGLRAYFKNHAWANATLDDLMGELGRASGRDLAAWTEGWLDTAGTDTLRLEPGEEAGFVLHASGPNGRPPRPHRLDLGVYVNEGGALVRREVIPLEVDGTSTAVPAVEKPVTLLLVNDNDQTFASVRPDDDSLAQLLDSAGDLPTATSRAVAVITVWDMLMDGALGATDFVRCANGVLAHETADSLVEPFLQLAVSAARRWAPDAVRDDLLSSIADTCLAIAEHGGTRRLVALRSLAQTAVNERQLAALRELTADDVDLSWRALTRFAALGQFDQAQVDALRERDPDPDTWVRALAVESAQPLASAKEATWRAVVEQHKVPMGSLGEVAMAFWQPSQADVLAPFAERYEAALPALASAGMIPAMTTAYAMFPLVGAGQDFVDRATSLVEDPEVSPVVGQRVLEQADQLKRMLAARGKSGMS